MTRTSSRLEPIRKRIAAREETLVRSDSAGASHELLAFCRNGNLCFSVGFDPTEPDRAAILALGEQAWEPATSPRTAQRRDDHAIQGSYRGP